MATHLKMSLWVLLPSCMLHFMSATEKRQRKKKKQTNYFFLEKFTNLNNSLFPLFSASCDIFVYSGKIRNVIKLIVILPLQAKPCHATNLLFISTVMPSLPNSQHRVSFVRFSQIFATFVEYFTLLLVTHRRHLAFLSTSFPPP